MNVSSYRNESSFRSFIKLLPQLKSPKAAWHSAFHRDEEQWQLLQFRDENEGFYLSRHRVTCSRCNVHHTVHHSWPKFNADSNQGFLLSEAHRRAQQYSGQG